MTQTLEEAYLLATSSDAALPSKWIQRAERLADSPSVAFIAAVGAVLLAKATDPRIDAFVIQEREGSPGAFSLRGPARRCWDSSAARTDSISAHPAIATQSITARSSGEAFGGAWRCSGSPWHTSRSSRSSSSGSARSTRSTSNRQSRHSRPTFAFVRQSRLGPSPRAALGDAHGHAPPLAELVDAGLEGFVSADPEGGARGMALAAAAFRSAGLEAEPPLSKRPSADRRADQARIVGS